MLSIFPAILRPWLLFLLIVGGPVGLAWIGTLLVHRHVKAPLDEKHNEVVGFIFAAEGVVYAVLLAFVVVVVWEQYQVAESAVSREAASLIAVARDSSTFPEPARGQVYDELRTYAQSVMSDEWKTMDEDPLKYEANARTSVAIHKVWSIYRSQPPGKVDPHTTDSLDNLIERRAERLASNTTAVPGVLWFVLVIGAVITICFCLALHMKNILLHAGATALLTALLAMCLWIIVLINHPFAGEVHVSPSPFLHAIYVIDSLPR